MTFALPPTPQAHPYLLGFGGLVLALTLSRLYESVVSMVARNMPMSAPVVITSERLVLCVLVRDHPNPTRRWMNMFVSATIDGVRSFAMSSARECLWYATAKKTVQALLWMHVRLGAG
jgi:hypothetical protein